MFCPYIYRIMSKNIPIGLARQRGMNYPWKSDTPNSELPIFKACKAVKSYLGGFCLSKDKFDDMNFNDKFYFSNKWGAALMLSAGVITADPYTIVAAGGALGANSAFGRLKEVYAKSALSKPEYSDDNQQQIVKDMAENRANIHINILKIVCHTAQAVGCEFFMEDTSMDAEGNLVKPSLEDVKSNLGAAAGGAYVVDALYTAAKQRELGDRLVGEEPDNQDRGIVGKLSDTFKSAVGKYGVGAVLTARGVATTACGAAVAVTAGGVAPILLTACGASYLAGGVYKLAHEYVKGRELDNTEDDTEEETLSGNAHAILPSPT